MLTDLYEIKPGTEETGKYSFEVFLNQNHAVYSGHFPGLPVTPGVCLLHIVKACALKIINKALRYEHIKTCKFLSVVNPEENNRLLVNLEIDDNNMIRASVNAEDKTVLKLKAKLIEL